MFYILFSIISLICIGFLLYYRFYSKKKFNDLKLMKILVIVFVGIAFLDVFLPDAFALRFNWSDSWVQYLKENHDPFHAVIRAFNAMAVITIPIAIFFKKPTFTKIVTFILIPTILINIICYNQYIGYYTSELTSYAPVFGNKLLPYLTNRVFRSIEFGTIMLLELVLSVYITLFNIQDLKFNNNKDVGRFFALTGALLFANIPIYTFQQIIGGFTNFNFDIDDPMHFIFIALIAVECFLLIIIFRNKSYEDKYILLLILSISLMFQYNSFFKTDGNITATRYPLQLCNIAGSFLIVTLLTKSEKMFHFTVVVNVVGAIIAIALCDSTAHTGVLFCMNIHYMVEHINVFLVPILGLSLHVFQPLKKKDFKDFFVGFCIYFAFVLILGTIFNGLQTKTGNGYWNCNYLFMFQKAAATRLVGDWSGILFDIKLTLFKYFNLYLVQIFIFLVFVGICTGIFFILYSIYKDKEPKLDHEKK